MGIGAALACRVVDLVTNALGAVNHPDAVLGAGGVAGTVLSIAAIVTLVRLNPRRAPAPGCPRILSW
jgi:hypothetical protein